MQQQLTPEMMECMAQWINRKALGITQKDLAKQYGVSERTIRRWIALPIMREYGKEIAVEIARESLPQVLNKLTDLAIKGASAKHIQLYLQVCGLIGNDSVNVNVNNNNKEDRRDTDEEIEAELEELKKLLGEEEYDYKLKAIK